MAKSNNNTQSINAILAAAPQVAKQSKETIYKVSLGNTQEDKKKARTKIRRTRDRFINQFLSAPAAERKALAAQWVTYATQLYKDIKVICDANTTEETKDMVNEFQVELAKVLNTK